jgi:hypothetical protein
MTLDDIKNNMDLVNSISWDMTPEDAVTLYLEWGNNPALGSNLIKSKDDTSYYFVVNTWKEPVIYLMRRNSQEAEELAAIRMPARIEKIFKQEYGNLKGVFAPEGEVKAWLKKELNWH